WLVMLTASVRSQSALASVSTGPVGPAMPALLTSTSRPPSLRSTASNKALTCASSDTSVRSVATPGSSACAAASAASSMSQIITCAPAARNARAIAKPMPLAPAVTKVRLPARALSLNVIAASPSYPEFFAAQRQVAQQRQRRPVMGNAATVQHQRRVGQGQRQVQVVVHDQDRDLAPQRPDGDR